MVYSLLILTTGRIMSVASKVCQDTSMLMQYFQNVFIIPDQVCSAIDRDVTYKTINIIKQYFNM